MQKVTNWIVNTRSATMATIEDAEQYLDNLDGSEPKAMVYYATALRDCGAIIVTQDEHAKKWKNAFESMFCTITSEDDERIEYAVNAIIKESEDIAKVLQAAFNWHLQNAYKIDDKASSLVVDLSRVLGKIVHEGFFKSPERVEWMDEFCRKIREENKLLEIERQVEKS